MNNEYPSREEMVKVLVKAGVKASKKDNTKRLEKKYKVFLESNMKVEAKKVESGFNQLLQKKKEQEFKKSFDAVERNKRRNEGARNLRDKQRLMSAVGANAVPQYKKGKRVTRKYKKIARKLEIKVLEERRRLIKGFGGK